MTSAPSDILYTNPSCELMVTTRCNMKCSYCIATGLPKRDMTQGIGVSAIDYFIYLSKGAELLDYIFTGGEPLLVFDELKYLIEYSVKKTNENGMGAKISIKTNGTLLRKEHIALFEKYKCTVFISIDGTEEDNNEYRLLKSDNPYKKAIESFKMLNKNKINCIASLTVHPKSAKNLFRGVKTLIGYGIKRINIAPAYGTVNWESSETDDFISSLLEIADFIKKEKAKMPDLDIGPINSNSEHTNCQLTGIWGCSAGTSNIAVLPDGAISGCSSLAMISSANAELFIGNVISGITQSKVDQFIEIAKADGNLRKKCMTCNTNSNCYGGCLAINYSTTKEAFCPPVIYCRTIEVIQKAWDIAWGDSDR